MTDSIAFRGFAHRNRYPTVAVPPEVQDGTVPVVSAVSYSVVDTAGGGERIVVTVDSSTGCTSISAGGANFTSFAIDDATHVSGVPAAHAAGVVDVVVTNATGPSTTGTGLIEYFSPLDLTPLVALMPGDYAVVGTQGVDAIGTWQDSSGNNFDAVSDGCVNAPAATSGNPNFVAADSLFLSIPAGLATAGGIGTTNQQGSIVAAVTPDIADADVDDQLGDYVNGTIVAGSGATPSCCFSTSGFKIVTYDDVTTFYESAYGGAAATAAQHMAFFKWNGDGVGPITISCRRNGGAFVDFALTTTALTNQGGTVEIGRSFAGSAYLDGVMKCVLIYAAPLTNGNATKIRSWGQQRGIAA